MIWQRKPQHRDAQCIQPAAEIQLAVPFGVPVGKKHNGGAGGSRAKKSRMHEIIFRPGRHNLARESKHASAGCPVLRRMQHVVVRRRRGKPDIAMGQCLIHPGIQKPARVGLIAPPANVLQAPFEGKDAAIVVGRPPGVLVAANFLFEPGHSVWTIEYRGVLKLCQTCFLLPNCFTLAAVDVVGARRVWQSQSVIPLGAFLFGLVVGSFLNVCILRIPADKSIVLPASSCPKCGKAIAPYDNIPVLSWLILGGKCRNCKTKISGMYPAVELLTGCLFLACYFVFGLTVDALKWAIFSALLVVLTITDLRERILPDSVNFFGVGVGLLFSFFTKPMDGTALWIANRWFDFPPPQPALSFVDAALGAVVGSGLLWVVAEGYFRLRG